LRKWLILGLLFIPTVSLAQTGKQQIAGSVGIQVNNTDVTMSNPVPITGTVAITSSSINYSVYNTVTTGAVTDLVLVPAVTGQTLYIYEIHVLSRSTTAGNVDFYWTGGSVADQKSIGGSIGSGYIINTYIPTTPTPTSWLWKLSEGLKVTTTCGACSITIVYRQF